MAPTSALGSVVRKAKRSLVVSPSLTFRTEVQFVQMPAKQTRGRVSSSANQMSLPSVLLNSLKELNGTTQRFSAPSHLVQCLLFTLRMLGGAAVRLHPQQFLEIDGFSFRFEL